MITESMLLNPTAHISSWDSLDDPAAAIPSYFTAGHVSPLDSPTAALMDFDSSFWEDPDLPSAVDAFSCDQFRMYEFKVRTCARGRSHDWTKCPYAHTGEKARRRDPRKFNYSGTECPDLRHGCCKKETLVSTLMEFSKVGFTRTGTGLNRAVTEPDADDGSVSSLTRRSSSGFRGNRVSDLHGREKSLSLLYHPRRRS